MTAVALRSRFFEHEQGLWGNLLPVLSTIILSSLLASIGFAQDAKSEKTGPHRSIERDGKTPPMLRLLIPWLNELKNP